MPVKQQAMVEHRDEPSASVRRITEQLHRRIGPQKYDMWFGQSTRLRVDGGHLEVATDSPFVAQWIEANFSTALQGVARQTLGEGARIEVRVSPSVPPARPAQPEEHPGRRTAHDHRPPYANGHPRRHRTGGRAGTHRRLEDFVVGTSNRLAYSTSCRLTEDPDARMISPLFIHGDCGVGKTHLLQGICRRYAELSGHWRSVRFVTGEQFTNEYLRAIRTHTMDAFRKRSRTRELLAIDDVHFLSNKVATQSEFLHTLDAIDHTGARIVLASDEHPRQIKRFSQALISRFLSGMVVKIERPDREMRIELVGRLAAARGLRLNQAAVEAIVGRYVGSVRELEGAVTKLAALREVTPPRGDNGEVGMALVEQLVKDPSWRPSTPVRIGTIANIVCQRLGIARRDLLGSGRHRRVVLGRGLIAYLGRELTTLSYPELAQALDRSHHSTMHTAAKRLGRQIGNDERIDVGTGEAPLDLRELVDQLKHAILRAPTQT